jgi:hypothetical protein
MASMPKFLVSVRNVLEAEQAVSGGCDLLDVKEPNHGSLGMAAEHHIFEVAQFAQENKISVSAALGDYSDWSCRSDRPQFGSCLDFVKLGLAGLGKESNWIAHWSELLDSFSADEKASPNWVAVIYADWNQANAPEPQAILTAAVKYGCAGILIDTWSKESKTLFDFLPESEIESIGSRAHSAGLFLALAGGIHLRQLPQIVGLEPDIIAVRSAACEDHDRTTAVSAQKVRGFRKELDRVCGLLSVK